MQIDQGTNHSFSPDHYKVNLTASGHRTQNPWPQQKLFQRTVADNKFYFVNQRKQSLPHQTCEQLYHA